MAVSHNREKLALSGRSVLRPLAGRLKRPRRRWQLGGAALVISTLVGVFGFMAAAHAQVINPSGETYTWVSKDQINVGGGRVAPNGNVPTWALGPRGDSYFANNMKDISGCYFNLSIKPSADHTLGDVTVTSTGGFSGCPTSVTDKFAKKVNIGNSAAVFPPPGGG
ncbi:MAG TPA: hypothetical protein VLF71_06070, partial [Candidatus Saccharimonadales bacterium]|nr:hypothetical protein [Candidatus Saccharimonadales bacterium]